MSRKTVILAGPSGTGKKAHGGQRQAAPHGGSPWLFSNEIRMDAATKAITPGSIVNVRDGGGYAIGTGHFNPHSLIAVRLLSAQCDAVIGQDFFAARLARALALRQRLYDKPFYRLAHGEGDHLPGLVIDRFADTLVVQTGSAGMERQADAIVAALDGLLAPQTIILRNDMPVRALEGLESRVAVLKGAGHRIQLEENGTRYFADLTEGQKTGWYYDQRDTRAFIAGLAKSKSVLDAYSYTGGFGIAAARAGAREVVCLDSSAPALALAEDSARANSVTIQAVRADVFTELERLAGQGEAFDIVLADPPPFVKARKDLEAGARAYRKLARMAALVTAKNGLLMLASCSHNISMERFAAECGAGISRAGRQGGLIRQQGAGADHPVHPLLPQSAYLKTLVYALD